MGDVIRLYFVAGAVLAVCAVLSSVYFLGGQSARDKAERDAMRDNIEASEKFNEGAADPDDCHWLGRLRATCPD